ncbi:MAG: hypothetical protein KA175_15900 [Flavobacteriales bacterium]|nr:hypothetical protein [Flavobacteriales bacterium]MBP6699105.1 hypothetical protein [Flavobacteriales bacterium]
MNPSTSQQIIGSISAGLATLLFLLRLQPFLWDWARKETSSDQWVTPALYILAPIWVLMMIALLCMTASGGFDWIRLSRTKLYLLTVAAAFALATASYLFIGLYLRPGFTPRGLYSPFLYLILFSTVLIMVVSLNQKLVPGVSVQWLLRPWSWFTALSLVGSLIFSGHWIATHGVRGLSGVALRIIVLLPAYEEELAQIAQLDLKNDFEKLLWRANRDEKRAVCEAATARLRSDPAFLERMAAMLDSGYAEPALSFVRDAELTPAEKARFARPALNALGRWVNSAPAPNFTTSEHLKRTRRFGDELFRVLPEKFAGTGVDFSEQQAWYEEKMK